MCMQKMSWNFFIPQFKKTPSILLKSQKISSSQAEGYISFEKKRYLHVDLAYWKNPCLKEISQKGSQEVFCLISERRKLALDKIHYFDHPKLGVIMSVRKIRVSQVPQGSFLDN